MSLNISAPDVLNYMGQVFTSIWPVLAIGLGLLAAPMVIRVAKAVFVRRG